MTSIMFVALLDLQLDLLVKVEDIAWFCYCFLKDPVEIESTSAVPGASFMQSICGFVRQSSVLKISLPMEEGNKEDCSWLEVVAEYRPRAPASDLPLTKRMGPLRQVASSTPWLKKNLSPSLRFSNCILMMQAKREPT